MEKSRSGLLKRPLGARRQGGVAIAILLIGIVASSFAVSPVRGLISSSSFLGTQTQTDNYYVPTSTSTCMILPTLSTFGGTLAGWEYGYCGAPYGNRCPCYSDVSDGVFGLLSQASNTQNLEGGGRIGLVDIGTSPIQYWGTAFNEYCSSTVSIGCPSGGLGCNSACPAGDSSYADVESNVCNTSVNANCYTFYIPNYGQTFTPVDLSTDLFVVGGLQVYTSSSCFLGVCSTDNAAALLSVTLSLKGNGETWTMSPISDNLECSSGGGSSCVSQLLYDQDFSPSNCTNASNGKAGTCSTTFYLPPGYYVAYLNATVNVLGTNNGGGNDQAFGCFYASGNCPYGTAISSCPSGANTVNGSCQYIQWKWTTYTFHYSDFSMTTPSALSLNSGSSTSATLTVNSVQVESNDAYSLSTPVTISATSNDPNLQFNPSPNPVTPPAGGSTSTTLTVSDSNGCDSGTYTMTLTASVNDAGGQTPSQSHSYSIPITVNPTCDFSICCSSSFSLVTGGEIASTGMNIQSLNGFSGTVSLSLSTTMVGDTSISVSPTSVTLSSGQLTSSTLTITTGSQTGTWSFTVTARSGNLVHTVTYTITVSQCCTGGGGSVAAGTLITLADGTQVPVQSLKAGMQLLSYDMTTHQYVITTITRFVTVMTYNQMVISTSTGKPLIVDQNSAQKLYVRLPDGTVTLMSVTDLKAGYDLFDAISQTWVPITSIHYENGGQHLMYDIYTTTPGNYIANGYLDPYKT